MKKFIYPALGFLLFSCGSGKVDDAELIEIDPAFSRYVSAFTGGTISSEGTIKVQFTAAVGKERKEDDMTAVFSIYPESEGTVKWLDDQTLEFDPTELLHSGVRYKGSVNLAELMEVEAGYELFEFNFRTIVKDFKVDIERFATYNASDYSKQNLQGSLLFTDVIDSA